MATVMLVESPRTPQAWYVARWGDDPFSRGSWSVLLPGGSPEHRRQLGAPIDGRLIVAGEATNPIDPAMTHGAWDEGRRAAQWARDSGARSVIVIGAGCAGLAAASALGHCGIETVVLEARDRIGGRVHTIELSSAADRSPVSVDAGAAWLQQFERNALARLAESLGVSTRRTDFARPLSAAADGDVPDVSGALRRLVAAIDTASREPLGALVQRYLAGLSPTDRRAAQFAIESDLVLESGVSLDTMSASSLTEAGVGNGDHHLPGGYGALLQHVAEGLDIRLGHVVDRIEWSTGQVAGGVDGRVRTGVDSRVVVGTLRADCCICTIPVSLLPSIEFVPGLPATHLDALDHLGMGVVEKVVLQFAERWWPVSPSGYLRWYDTPASWGEWLDLTDSVGVPVIAGLIAGDAVARHHHGRSDQQVALAAAAALAQWADSSPV